MSPGRRVGRSRAPGESTRAGCAVRGPPLARATRRRLHRKLRKVRWQPVPSRARLSSACWCRLRRGIPAEAARRTCGRSRLVDRGPLGVGARPCTRRRACAGERTCKSFSSRRRASSAASSGGLGLVPGRASANPLHGCSGAGADAHGEGGRRASTAAPTCGRGGRQHLEFTASSDDYRFTES